jgi:hypothetical protein
MSNSIELVRTVSEKYLSIIPLVIKLNNVHASLNLHVKYQTVRGTCKWQSK